MLAANPVLAAGKKKPNPNAGVAYYKTIDKMLSNLTLTDDEETKLTALKADNKQKFVDAYAKIKNVLTPDQQKAGEAAKKEAKEAGKSNKEQNAAFNAAAKETDDQKVQAKQARKELRALEKEFKGKVIDLLTAEQKAEIQAANPPKGSKPAKPADTAPAPATPAPATPAPAAKAPEATPAK